MTNKLFAEIRKEDNKTGLTANGAKTLKSSLNACVDLFGVIGGLRQRSESEVVKIFTNAYAEDPLKAMKILMHARDVRGGLGERKVPRTIFKYMAEAHTASMRKNIKLIPEFGRWDDLYSFVGTPLEKKAMKLLCKQLKEDVDAEYPSLAAKWAKSTNTSSKESRKLGALTAKYLEMSHKDYRKMLSRLRKKIGIVENAMCSGEWTNIKYDAVTSRAAMIYRDAFKKHDPTGYQKFLDSVEKGEAKINASTLYPYDIVCKARRSLTDKTLDLQWKSLPNYVDEPFNGLVMADTSGSMGGLPIEVSISLAIYIAERNEGAWKDHFISFSGHPELVKIKGSTIQEKIRSFTPIHTNTNLQAGFDMILNTAKKHNLKKKDMPEKILIISDMEFDVATRVGYYSGGGITNYSAMKRKYKAAGYKMPEIVFWNVNGREGNSPVTFNKEGVALVSGCSPSILKSVLGGEITTPEDIMNQTIEVDRYSKVRG